MAVGCHGAIEKENRRWSTDQSVSQSVSHYHTPSRELMTHTMTSLTRVRVRRESLDQSKYRVDVMILSTCCGRSRRRTGGVPVLVSIT